MKGLQNILRSLNDEQALHWYKAVISFMLALLLALSPGLAFATAGSELSPDLAEGAAESAEACVDEGYGAPADNDQNSSLLDQETGFDNADAVKGCLDDPNATGSVLRPADQSAALELAFFDYLEERDDHQNNLKQKSEYERALLVHDFMIGCSAIFDPQSPNDSLDDFWYSILEGKACSSKSFYAAFVYLLAMDEVGITNVVMRESDDQAWALVQLDGQWTHIDVAIDKAVATQSFSHICFGLTDDQIKLVHEGYVVDESRQAITLDNNFYHRGNPRPTDGLDQGWINAVDEKIKQGIGKSTSGLFDVEAPVIGNAPIVDKINLLRLVYSQIAVYLSGQSFNGVVADVAYIPEGDPGFFKISEHRSIANATVVYVVDKTYTGKPIEQNPQVALGGILEEGTDYKIVYEENTYPGTATMIIKGLGVYAGTEKRIPFTINKAEVSEKTIKIPNLSLTVQYTGRPITQDHVNVNHVVNGGLTSNDYDIKYKNNTEGEYATLYIVGKGNYTGTYSTIFRIVKDKTQTSTSNSGNNSSSNSNANNGATNVTVQSAPSAPTVTGKWAKSGSRWWFKLDAKSQTALKSSKNYPAGRWVTISKKRYYFDNSGWMKTGWLSYGGKWYYLGSDGAMKTGWQKSGGKWYYMASDGIMQTGKKNIGSQTYYLNTSSGAMKIGWNKEGSTWYYYGSSGAMAKGWLKSGGKWYYLAGNGAMQTTKQTISGKTYNFNKSGVMITGWNKESGTYYHYGSSGAMSKGWVKSGSKWYFMDKSTGAMKTAWVDDGGSRYFMHPTNGEMLTGWNKITTTMSGKATSNFYYFSSSGVLQKNKWIGNYYVESDGKMATDRWIGKYHVNASGLWDATKK